MHCTTFMYRANNTAHTTSKLCCVHDVDTVFKPQARDLHCVADCVGVGASWGWRRRCLGYPKGRCARRLAQPYRQYLLLCNIRYICFVCLVFVCAFVLSCLSFCHRSQCNHIRHSGVVSACVLYCADLRSVCRAHSMLTSLAAKINQVQGVWFVWFLRNANKLHAAPLCTSNTTLTVKMYLYVSMYAILVLPLICNTLCYSTAIVPRHMPPQLEIEFWILLHAGSHVHKCACCRTNIHTQHKTQTQTSAHGA